MVVSVISILLTANFSFLFYIKFIVVVVVVFIIITQTTKHLENCN